MRTYFHDAALQSLLDRHDAFVFDMNGLLIDDEPLQLAAYNEVLRARGLSITRDWWIGRCLGRRGRQFMSEFFTAHGQSPTLFDEILPLKERAYDALLAEAGTTLIRPGVCTLIAHLRAEGMAIALATSAARRTAEPILSLAGLSMECFDAAVCGDDVAHGKPAPDVFLKVRDLLPTRSGFLVFEDAPPGVTAAVAAEMSVIAVPNDFTRACDFSSATMVVTDLTPAARIVERAPEDNGSRRS